MSIIARHSLNWIIYYVSLILPFPISKFGAAGGVLTTMILDTMDVVYSIYMFIGVLAFASIITFTIPTETVGTILQDEIRLPLSGSQTDLAAGYGALNNSTALNSHDGSS